MPIVGSERSRLRQFAIFVIAKKTSFGCCNDILANAPVLYLAAQFVHIIILQYTGIQIIKTVTQKPGIGRIFQNLKAFVLS
jgi:hypothetical protein